MRQNFFFDGIVGGFLLYKSNFSLENVGSLLFRDESVRSRVAAKNRTRDQAWDSQASNFFIRNTSLSNAISPCIKRHSLRSLPLQGPKKSRFSVPTPCNDPQNGFARTVTHVNKKYINNKFSVVKNGGALWSFGWKKSLGSWFWRETEVLGYVPLVLGQNTKVQLQILAKKEERIQDAHWDPDFGG